MSKSKGVASHPQSAGTRRPASPDRSEIGARKRKGRLFSATVAAAVCGAPYRNVDYWARIGLAVPGVAANGRGSDRQYSKRDIEVLTVVAAAAHFPVALRRVLVEAIRRDPSGVLIIVPAGQFLALTVDLAAVRQHVTKALAKCGYCRIRGQLPERRDAFGEQDPGEGL